jgi:hypothetical protein
MSTQDRIVFSQLPGEMDLEFIRGDSLAVEITFADTIADYTFEAAYEGGTFSIEIDLATKKVVARLTKEQTAAIKASRVSWAIRWSKGAEVRTIFRGNLESKRFL